MFDLKLVNANVVTVDGRRPRARSVAISGNRIAALDADGPAHRVIDLDGATVTPGFHDAHNHMAWYGLTLSEVDLRSPGIGSLEQLYRAIADRSGGPGWVLGSGYDQNKIGGHPDRDALDRAAPGQRVWLKHTSGHMCVVNSLVLQDLGMADRAVDVPGGLVVTDAAGRPTGLLQEQAQQLVNELVLPYPVSTLVDAIDLAGQQYLREGITSCVEAGIGGGWIGKSPVELAAYQSAREQRRLRVRVELMIAADALHPLAAHAEDDITLGLDLGLRTGFGDDWLRIGPVKVFSDGSLIGHTAAMCHDFADSPGERGYLQDDADRLRATILAAHRSGWRVATHAIGDAAIDLVLEAYAEALDRFPRYNHRHRIEHFGVSRPDQVARAAELGVIPVPQGRFAHEIGDGMLRALGPERVPWAYRQRSLLDAGIIVPGSSDRPVVHGAPLLGMHDMVNQLTSAGRPFNPTEAVSAAEALRAFTYGSAYASGEEDRKGTVTPGKLADLTVLSEDPTAVDPGRIRDIQVLATFVDGRRAFGLDG
ncbi:amidohydrolase [Kutzneria albida]|uniref:Exoenzymes regulatory protein AepA n=1 Tax=Kutzneria albida DSM 43870 TaxID=1449976 RepID=W5W7C2_9PSEU|nr:amidohydrolase [Kutzneria albida]AHH96615.1 exoenzymes regulatory protein AepA precursor [Kutzneria albida DSM 43870]